MLLHKLSKTVKYRVYIRYCKYQVSTTFMANGIHIRGRRSTCKREIFWNYLKPISHTSAVTEPKVVAVNKCPFQPQCSFKMQ